MPTGMQVFAARVHMLKDRLTGFKSRSACIINLFDWIVLSSQLKVPGIIGRG